MHKFLLVAIIILFVIINISGCRDTTVADRNLSIAAGQFEIRRRIVFYNDITGEYLLVIEGLSSIKYDKKDKQLEVIVKTGPKQFKKHFLGLSDNVTYFAEQIDPSDVDVYHYRVIFKPSVIVPNIDVE